MAATGIELDSVGRNNMGKYQRLPSVSRLGDDVDQRPMISGPPKVEQATNNEPNRPTQKPHLAPSSYATTTDQGVTKSKAAFKKWRGPSIVQCLLHAIPLAVTLIVLGLNIFGVYWQDLGLPHQKAVLQALQYAAKAHEIMMTASLSAIVIHQAQHGLSDKQGLPFGLLTGGFKLGEPFYLCTKQFLGASVVRKHSDGGRRFYPISILILVGILLTLVVGPSSAVAMIPRLDWWDVPQTKAFGNEYKDRVYFNRTEDELWPQDITNTIYANTTFCRPVNVDNQDCAVRAMDSVSSWITDHQDQGTKPNITIFQDTEIIRYLTSQGGPPDNSSWTVTSTANSIFARDLVHYWEWLVENTTLPTNIARPLIRPHFVNSTMKLKKPLVQTQCQTWLEPDWANGNFAFPHDELLTPPLDQSKHETWKLPNAFILNLKGNDSNIGDMNDTQHPHILFDWFDAASNFSAQGAPSLGAVILYKARGETGQQDALTACSIEGRWAPVELYIDPRDTVTLYQSSPNPMDMLNGTAKAALNDLVKMKISLEWANTINVDYLALGDPPTSVVEFLLGNLGSPGKFGQPYEIYPEPEPSLYYVMKSIDWRLSTVLGLYTTEALARAFQDNYRGSMLYRQAKDSSHSYVRYLNDINDSKDFKEGYRNGRLDWVETRDSRWNSSILPWDEWAPQNGYSEITFTVQRNGYGYGFESLPTIFAAAVLIAYVIVAATHIVLLAITGRVYGGCSDAGQLVALAWSSPAAPDFKCTSSGVQDAGVWKRIVKVEEDEQQLLLRPTDG